MASVKKTMNHSDYIAKTKTLSISALRHIMADASAAITAMPDNPNAGYYADEIHYCSMELSRRSKN